MARACISSRLHICSTLSESQQEPSHLLCLPRHVHAAAFHSPAHLHCLHSHHFDAALTLLSYSQRLCIGSIPRVPSVLRSRAAIVLFLRRAPPVQSSQSALTRHYCGPSREDSPHPHPPHPHPRIPNPPHPSRVAESWCWERELTSPPSLAHQHWRKQPVSSERTHPQDWLLKQGAPASTASTGTLYPDAIF